MTIQLERTRSSCLKQKKWSLLAVFSLGIFIDIWMYSAFYVFTGPIAIEFEVPFEQQTWIITSYAVTFAAFLLFWGRVSDLFSAKPVFAYGFISLGLLNIVISFLTDRYSFFVIRAISGIAGATLIPAAFRLIVSVFAPHELPKAFTLYGLSGVLANSTGIIVAGVFEFIPAHGQNAAWRWFFRAVAILILPVAIGCLFWIPEPKTAICRKTDRFRQLDIPGAFLMLSAIILLTLGLTLGASYGWKTAGFLAPFLLSLLLAPAFFIWEAHIPKQYALLPSSTWRIKNFSILIVISLFIYSWWGANFLPLIETWVRVEGERPIIAAVRVLPQSMSSTCFTVLLTLYPRLVDRPRWTISIGLVAGVVGYILFSQSTSRVGADYWRYFFPGFVLGSAGTTAAFTGVNVGIMTSVPPDMAGIAGAVLQVSLQIGTILAFSIQAGLLTVHPGGINNWTNVQISFYFMIGWGVVWLLMFLSFYREPGRVKIDQESNGDELVICEALG